MTVFLWALGLGLPIALVCWARQMSFDQRRQLGRFDPEIHFQEDTERAVRHHCPLCRTKRTFLECRLTGRDSLSVWIPNLRFCIECGSVLHIEEVRVLE